MSPSQSVADLGEHALIARLRARVAPAPWVLVGIGDDAAVMAPARGEQIVVTTDALVEGIHFNRAWSSPESVGYKALAVSLSDLAAMGATGRGALLSLGLPPTLPVAEFDGILDGFLQVAGAFHTPLVGGNLTRSSGPLFLDVTAIGSARARRLVRRDGGRPGDDLYVTGTLGAAAAGLAVLRSGATRDRLAPDLAACVDRYERPEPRLGLAVRVARSRSVHAGMDASDGLADAVRQIGQSSNLGAIVDASAIPVHPGARTWAEQTASEPIRLALSGGEDYELLFAVPPRRRRAFLAAVGSRSPVPVTRIGQLTRSPGLWLDTDGRREPLGTGFVHF